MSDKISSLGNPKIKQVVRLRQRRARDEAGVTIIEGFKELRTALQAAPDIQRVFFCPEMLTDEQKALLEHPALLDADHLETTRAVYDKIAYGDRGSGILAICHTPRFDLNSMRPSIRSLLVVLEQVEKPGNLGAIIRTADAAGAGGVLVCDVKTDIFNPNVIRASLGTVFSLPVVSCRNEEALTFLRKHEFGVMATLPDARNLYYKTDFNRRSAIVLGSEEKGLTPFWIDAANEKIKLPMKGRADSLNVSVTAAIICYEAYRQKQK